MMCRCLRITREYRTDYKEQKKILRHTGEKDEMEQEEKEGAVDFSKNLLGIPPINSSFKFGM